jgi:hypothetical protein
MFLWRSVGISVLILRDHHAREVVLLVLANIRMHESAPISDTISSESAILLSLILNNRA